MELHLPDLHIVIANLQNRDDHSAFIADGFQLIGRRAEYHLKMLILEEIQHQLYIMIAHLLEWLVDEDQPDRIHPDIIKHGERCRENQGIRNLRSRS